MESRVCKKAITIFAEDLMGELTETVCRNNYDVYLIMYI